ncbi:NAD(P)/FAD-dependent oxidoreductase [Streptomyces griseoviridis]|jgi:thioredoxin reductase|uniref:Thioredoxin reductase n=1 Tax=Streptomyces griseoviridis TaxID=45398 RepID=A0A918GPC6_STRGD|nr:NAD(P)/FAD-dependent oxidoreductase [Streptomyces niveoruber]GGS52271.1 thioredoxin reductase [Streptomyces niveoruber]
MENHQIHDVIVIGGGAAGLNAALTLGRARRTVLLVDAGRQRNAPAHSMHNYLGHEGIAPADFLALARQEVARFGTRSVGASVVAAKRAADGLFEVVLDDDTVARARRLLLATGLVDELPDVPGVAERWAREVLHCPYCHGWEVRDRAIGVLATGPVGVEQALLWSQWSGDITLFTHTGPRLDDTARARLAARDVRVVEGEVSHLDVAEGPLRGVVLSDGRRSDVGHLVVAPRFTARLDGLDGLGLETAELQLFGQVAGSHVVSNPQGATSVAGVYAAGNVTSLTETVIGAAAAGLKTAAAVNLDLITEDTRRAVAAPAEPGV